LDYLADGKESGALLGTFIALTDCANKIQAILTNSFLKRDNSDSQYQRFDKDSRYDDSKTQWWSMDQ